MVDGYVVRSNKIVIRQQTIIYSHLFSENAEPPKFLT